MMNRAQMNRLCNSQTPDGETIRLKYTALIDPDIDAFLKVLSKSQHNRVEKRKREGKGVELTFRKPQIEHIRKMRVEAMQPKRVVVRENDQDQLGTEILENPKLQSLLKRVYMLYVRPLQRRKIPYSDAVHMLMLIALMRHKSFMSNINELNKLTDRQIVRIVQNLDNIQFGKGAVSDFFSKVKNAIVDTARTIGRILSDVPPRFINRLNDAYSNPLKIVKIIGKLAIGIATENPAILTDVAADVLLDIGDAATRSLKDSIQKELGGTAADVTGAVMAAATPSNIQAAKDVYETIKDAL